MTFSTLQPSSLTCLIEAYKKYEAQDFNNSLSLPIKYGECSVMLTINKTRSFVQKLSNMGIQAPWTDCTYVIDGKDFSPLTLEIDNASLDEFDFIVSELAKHRIIARTIGSCLYSKEARLYNASLASPSINNLEPEIVKRKTSTFKICDYCPRRLNVDSNLPPTPLFLKEVRKLWDNTRRLSFNELFPKVEDHNP